MLFNNIETSIDQLLEKAKFHSFWWLSVVITPFLCTVLKGGGRIPYFV